MSDWLSYRFQDFIPFTLETYNDVLMRANSEHWPWHALVGTLALVACFYAIKGRPFIAFVTTSMLWACCAFFFFAGLYQEINVAGTFISYIFYLQGAMMLGYGFITILAKPKVLSPSGEHGPDTKVKWLGSFIVITSLSVYPLYGFLWANNLSASEFAGLHPDPTAILTLGLLFLTTKGVATILLAFIPMLWLLISWQTLEVIGSDLSPIISVSLALGLLGLFLQFFNTKKV